ncbi:PadR family transcriptional regulator [Actinoallomurus iriomotensis]|nr:PadR family transcriptional regulator [Actinoallomurus iriomotensis]
MSYVDVMILRHLMRTPAHGYELRKHVEANTGFVLHNNSLYPALRRFEEAGAVTKTAEAQEGRPPRHVYEITELGREMLLDLLTDLPVSAAGDESEFLVRLAQFDLLAPDERSALLDAREAAVRARLEQLRALRERAGDERWGALANDHLIDLCDVELAWLTRLRAEAAEDHRPQVHAGDQARTGLLGPDRDAVR